MLDYLDYAEGDETPRSRHLQQMQNQVALFNDGNHHKVIDHVGHGTGALEGYGADRLIQSSAIVINPCPKHPLNEIAFLDKTTKEGACEICMPAMLRANHELLPINQTITEVIDVLNTLDIQVNEI